MEGPEITFAEAVLDNGKFGKRVVRFETGRLAQQAQGAVSNGVTAGHQKKLTTTCKPCWKITTDNQRSTGPLQITGQSQD